MYFPQVSVALGRLAELPIFARAVPAPTWLVAMN
jgi:hypothetical protein